MPDYKSMPRQRGVSETPYSETNPRRFARTRCDKAMGACDKIIMYMGELIQTYKPENLTPTDAVKMGLEVSDWAKNEGIDFQSLIDLADIADDNLLPIGKFSGHIALAALMMNAAKEMRDTIADFRSTI